MTFVRLPASETMRDRAGSDDEDITEFAVQVRWLAHGPVSQAVSERSLFASLVTACELRDERTIEHDHAFARIERAETDAVRRWELAWGDDDVLVSVPGMGRVALPTVRAFFGNRPSP